uniref:tetraspanin family protein n=1 Tax=Salmonella sp. s54925 TaxID=3159674 RepID=UPI00398153A5
KHYNDTKYQEAFDSVQKEFDCCGISSYTDWANHSIAVPKSCCKNSSPCNVTSDYYKDGCADKLFDYLKDHMALVGGLAVGVAVIQIVGIIFACIVRRDVKEGYNYV